MAVAYAQITIDEENYTISQLTAGKSLKLLTRLAKVVGPAIAEFAMKDGLKKGNAKVEESISNAIPLLFDRLDGDELVETVGMILEGVSINGVGIRPVWETKFQGKLGALFKLLQESVKVQYGDFSSVLTLIASRAQATGMGTGSSAQSTSNGPSGG